MNALICIEDSNIREKWGIKIPSELVTNICENILIKIEEREDITISENGELLVPNRENEVNLILKLYKQFFKDITKKDIRDASKVLYKNFMELTRIDEK